MDSFKKQLNASSEVVKSTRVNNFIEGAVAASAALIEAKRVEIREKQNQLAELMDISPETTMDLSTKLSKVDTRDLMEKIHTTQVELTLAQEVMGIMIKTHNDLFPEFPEKADKYASK